MLASQPAYADDVKVVSNIAPVKKITLVYTKKSKGSIINKISHRIYTEAFRRLGLEYAYKLYPAKRCSLLSDRGHVDGEGGRIREYGITHTNLLRIETPVLSARWAAYGINHNIKINGWESLKGTDYKIDYRRGVKLCEVKLPDLVKKENLSAVNDISFGLKRLIKGRADVYVDVEMFVDSELKTSPFQNSGIYKICLMQELPLYAYLHKKHKSLVPKLAMVLQDMNKEGLMKKYTIFSHE